MLWYAMVWYAVVWHGMVFYGMVGRDVDGLYDGQEPDYAYRGHSLLNSIK